jgi:regulator of nucleoside diphosphate kinase
VVKPQAFSPGSLARVRLRAGISPSKFVQASRSQRFAPIAARSAHSIEVAMLYESPTATLPRIVVGEAEEYRLSALATAASLTGKAGAAKTLLAEMERASVVRDADVPPDVVRMQSVVEFEIDGANRRLVRIVYPGEADIDSGRISILTPIGTALIGLSPGQKIPLQGHDGRAHTLAVLSVAPGEG